MSKLNPARTTAGAGIASHSFATSSATDVTAKTSAAAWVRTPLPTSVVRFAGLGSQAASAASAGHSG